MPALPRATEQALSRTSAEREMPHVASRLSASPSGRSGRAELRCRGAPIGLMTSFAPLVWAAASRASSNLTECVEIARFGVSNSVHWECERSSRRGRFDLLVDHFAGIHREPVGRKADFVAELQALLDESIPEEPSDAQEYIWAIEGAAVDGHAAGVDHPRFFASCRSPNDFLSVIGRRVGGGLRRLHGHLASPELRRPSRVDQVHKECMDRFVACRKRQAGPGQRWVQWQI